MNQAHNPSEDHPDIPVDNPVDTELGIPEPAAAGEVEDVAALKARITELTGQLQDEQLRSVANEQNLRRRHQEELQAAHKFASQKFATDLLTVKDYLEMALQDESGQFDALKMGVNMTLTELEKAFEKAHISSINPQAGDVLDPYQHQALQTVASDLPTNSIVGVLKKGYALSDRVLRPAMVTVAKAADATDA